MKQHKPRRFRPSTAALTGTRAYQPKSPQSKTLATPRLALKQAKNRRFCSDTTRVGRFIRRHAGSRLAMSECEPTLLYMVTTFATVVGEAASAEAASRGARGPTEEGDLRKALARLRGTSTAACAAQSSRTPQSLHPALLEIAACSAPT